MTTYLDIKSKSIQYENKEGLIKLEHKEEDLEKMQLDEIRELVKAETKKHTDFHYWAV